MLETSPTLPQRHLGEQQVILKTGWGRTKTSQAEMQHTVYEMTPGLGRWGRRQRNHEKRSVTPSDLVFLRKRTRLWASVLAGMHGTQKYGKDVLGRGDRKAGETVSCSWRAGINSCLWLTWQRWNLKWLGRAGLLTGTRGLKPSSLL